MRLLVGLGNPGSRYVYTRHNIGFLIIGYFASRYHIPFFPGKGDYLFAETELFGEEIRLIKPTSYMNRSGWAVKQACEHFVVSSSEILIIYDDFHLNFGELRFRKKGSSGGHNGIESIIYYLETEEVPRLRVGIGQEFSDSVDFVLSEFSQEEKDKLPVILKKAMEGIAICMGEGMEKAMNDYNRNVLIDPTTN